MKQEDLLREIEGLRRRLREIEDIQLRLANSERALRESEERFRLLYEDAPLAYQSLDENGNFLAVNQAWLDSLGYSRDEVIGKWYGDFLTAAYREKFRVYFPQFKAAGEIHGIEFEMLGRDGTRKIVSVDGRIGYDNRGRFKQTHCILHDISEIKRSHDALKESEQRYRAIVDKIETGISVLNPKLEIVEINKALTRCFPHVQPACGQICYEQYNDPPRSEPCSYCPCVRTLEDGEVHEAIIETPAGSQIRNYRIVSSPIKDSRGQVQYIIELTEDITERKKAEEQFRASEERFRTLIDWTYDWELWIDASGGIRYTSPSCGRITGFAPDEFTDDPSLLSRIVHPADKPTFEEHMERIYQSNSHSEEATLDFRIIARDGSERWIEHICRPVRDADGTYLGRRVSNRDITDRKRAERALQDSEERLRMTLEATKIGIWDWDVKNDQWYASPTYFTMLGYEPATGPGDRREWLEPVHPDDRAHVNEKIQNVLTRNFSEYEYEARLRHADGTYRWQHVRGMSVESDEGGQVTRMLGIRMDVDQRNSYEEALQAANEYNRSLIESSLDPLVTISSEGTITDVNTATESVTGCSRQELIGTDFADYFSDPQEARAGYQEAFKVGAVRDYELNIRHRNGNSTPVMYNASVYRDRSGEVVGLLAAARDITELRRAEKRAEEQIRFQQLLMDATPSPIFFKDREGRYLGCNEAFSKYLGLPKTEIVGKSVFELCPEHLADVYHAKDLELFTRGGIQTYESKVRYADATEHDVIFYKSTFPDPDGTVGGLIGVILDITEQNRAQQRLRESEAFYRSLYENISDCIFIIDVTPEGRFKFVSFNPAEERAVGMTTEQVANKFPEDLVSEDVAAHVNSRYRMCVEKRETIHYEEVLDLPKGKMSFLTSLVPLEGPDGRIYRIIGVAKDISEQKNLQRQLLQAQKMEAIGILAGGIAHDFNNLLQVTLGYSELLLQEKSEQDPEYADLRKIHQSARSGSELVRNLLAFSRKVEPKPVPMDLNHEVMHIEKLLHRTIPKMIEIRLDLGGGLERINADPAQMEQIIMNLAVNARDAMGEKGSLTIRTENVTLDEEYCRLNIEAKPGDYVLLSVSDTGHGMDKDTLQHIFEPFFTTKELGRGTGLGLAMIYGIVKQHGGHIDCYSEVGNGTTFKLYFPAIPSIEEPAVEDTAIMPAFGTETVLLVDDEDFVRDLGDRILTKNGYTVLSAADAEEALEVYNREKDRIALIIVDLIMPTMGGKDCLKRILDINPHTKVLIASGHSADASMRECIELGAKGFVTKPFRLKDLVRQVRKTLDES